MLKSEIWVVGGFVLAVLISGCSGTFRAPQSVEELRLMSESGRLFRTYPLEVHRNISEVNASLSEAAEKCLNLTKSISVMVRPTNPPIMRRENITYSAEFRSGETGEGELTLRRRILTNPSRHLAGSDDYLAFAVKTHPASSGTQLAIWSIRMGSEELREAVRSWAEGGAVSCPHNLP